MTKAMSGTTTRLVLWLTVFISAFGQGPITDHLVVNLPNTTWVGSQSLAPGKYTIRQLPTASNPRLLEFSSDDGTKLEVAVTAIAAIENNTPRETSVVLKQLGGQHHLTHVWIAGKTYGYELPVNDSKQLATASEKVTLAATYSPAPQEVAANRPPAPAPAPEPAPAPAPQAAPEPAPVAQAPAQPQAAPTPTPAPTPEPAQAPQTREPAPTAQTNAQLAAQTPPMPRTAAHWPDLVVAGLVLMTFGALLTRRRSANA